MKISTEYVQPHFNSVAFCNIPGYWNARIETGDFSGFEFQGFTEQEAIETAREQTC